MLARVRRLGMYIRAYRNNLYECAKFQGVCGSLLVVSRESGDVIPI